MSSLHFVFEVGSDVSILSLGADGSRYQSICELTEPSQPMMSDDVLTQIDHNTGNYVPYSLRILVGSLTSHRVICEQGL